MNDNDDLINAMLSDSDETEQAPDTLKRITSLATLLVSQEAEVERVEAEVKRLKEDARRTREEDLPTLMKEVGLLTVKLEDGSTVDVKDDVSCAISEDRRAEAHAWLNDNGFGGLIKNVVSVAFGKGDDERERAESLVFHLSALGLDFERKEAVHASTLKSFVKETLAKMGEDPDAPKIPFEPFAIRPFAKAVVKPPKLAAAKKATARRKAGLL